MVHKKSDHIGSDTSRRRDRAPNQKDTTEKSGGKKREEKTLLIPQLQHEGFVAPNTGTKPAAKQDFSVTAVDFELRDEPIAPARSEPQSATGSTIALPRSELRKARKTRRHTPRSNSTLHWWALLAAVLVILILMLASLAF